MTDHKKLKKKLSENNMTQSELAKRTGFDEPYISKICNNDVNSQEDTLKKLAGAIGCTIDEIV